MPHIKIKSTNEDRPFKLADNETITLRGRAIQIQCLHGLIWVTWPDGNERVVTQGRSVSVYSRGMICVQAFAASFIKVLCADPKMPQPSSAYQMAGQPG